MSAKEIERLRVLQRVEAGSLTVVDAAEILNLSYRQASRIWQRYQEWGVHGLSHKSRGMPGKNCIDESLRKEALRLYKELYWDFGPTLAAEKLLERNDLQVNHETLRRWLIGDCQWSGKTKHRKHRRRRPRKEHFGELTQVDGSEHKWLEDRGPKGCLMVMVDDATGDSMAFMNHAETIIAAIRLLKKWILRYGVPLNFYADRKNIYIANRDATDEEKRQGTGPLTVFGKICARLGIGIIPAGSPQAKGRVERKNGVLQDRLVKELRLRGISTIDDANAMIDEFMENLNQRFRKEPMKEANYHRFLPPDSDLDFLLRIEYTRRLSNDWIFEHNGIICQIGKEFANIQPRSKLTVCEILDAPFLAIYNDINIPYKIIGRK